LGKNVNNDKLIWVDLETTGLDLDDRMHGCIDHCILEVGVHLTDTSFNIIDEGLQIVIHHPAEYMDMKMIPFVKEMHTNNGLLDMVKTSVISTALADMMIVRYLEKHNVPKGVSPICGNSVSFDKNFIAAQMPEFMEFLHYRKIDVSSFKEVARNLMPEVALLVDQLKQHNHGHRALDDIKMSINEMQIYRDHMLKYTS
jgi:oligoribonuclease